MSEHFHVTMYGVLDRYYKLCSINLRVDGWHKQSDSTLLITALKSMSRAQLFVGHDEVGVIATCELGELRYIRLYNGEFQYSLTKYDEGWHIDRAGAVAGCKVNMPLHVGVKYIVDSIFDAMESRRALFGNLENKS